MKKVIIKTLKFISSRLSYLIIGIFLAAAVSFVYATWDDARTGGSEQLSENNWNELVNMLESEIAALGGGGPGSWDCEIVTNTAGSVSCSSGYKILTGGCSRLMSETSYLYFAGGYPANTTLWRCVYCDSTRQSCAVSNVAYAICCK